MHGGSYSYQSFYHAFNSPEVRGKGAHVGNNAGESEWFSKPELVDAAREVMGGIDLDPASTGIANEVIGALHFFTKDSNGLVQPWAGRVWMNPPYSQPAIADFCDKLAHHFREGDVTEACPSPSTDIEG